MNRKRILYVEQNTDGTTGGSHFCLLDTVRHLDRDRFDPLVVFYRENALLDEFRRLCPIFMLPVPPPVNLAAKLPCPLNRYCIATKLAQKGINLLRCKIPPFLEKIRFIRSHRVDLVHLNNGVNRGYDWVLACRIFGVRCITHDRGLFRLTGSDRFFARRFDAIVSIAGFLRDELRRQGVGGGWRSVVINDGIDPEEITSRLRRSPEEVRREFGIGPADPLIGIVGNIREWKGQDVVVRAVHLLAEAHPTLRCLVIGAISDTRSDDREYLRSIEAIITGHGLGERVLLLGYRDDVPDLVNSLDILVHASVSPEPFGRVILEGMVLSRPVIATNIGGPREIIEDRISGLLVPPADAAALAGAVDSLLGDAGMRGRIARSGKRRVVERFHIDRYIEQVHDLYERLLS